MTESIESPLALPAARRRFLKPAAGARPDAGVEDKILKLERQSGSFKRLIAARVGRRFAEDVWQSALLQMTEHLQRGHEVANLYAYMRTVCVNCANKELGRQYRRSEVMVGGAAELDLQGAEDAELDDSGLRYSDVRDILAAALTPLEHQVYVLRHVFGMTSKDIGRHLDRSPAAVRQTLSRADGKLRDPEVLACFDHRLTYDA
ncbi:RNA polymerase sigma factor [Streptomyces cavernicola]|uniref:Sigma-70 family RNA polymerase sigma factor n=1 Tax=Streptomyces cavernicola TaxID=3043613 RepID=A0ABT6SFG7_9ACTN|nr:sigma-70 family RNA polymerase sigma factor [Streptomyces sp. B-S-A6]MDI3406031.1 sigma-70 family RNA polymerase sigma factor [Streptomyces sp. B-S-A6]